MMRATHTDYKHPRHLRVVDGDVVLCVAPSHSQYSRLLGKGLPKYPPMDFERPSAERLLEAAYQQMRRG